MLYVEHMREVDEETWDRLLLTSPGGSHVLQTHAWGEFKGRQGWTPLRLVLRDDDAIVGVAQILVRAIPGTTGAVAYCPKGPWVDWSRDEHVDTLLGGMEHFARRRGAYILKIESELLSGPEQPRDVPLSVESTLHRVIEAVRRARREGIGRAWRPDKSAADPVDEDKRVHEARAAIVAVREEQARDGGEAGRRRFAERGFVKSRWDMQFRTTMVIDLDRSPDEMLARMKSKWRYNINLAQRKGVTVGEDNSVEARRVLYEMYARTAARDGFILRSSTYFEDAWETMIEAGHAHIFFAYHDGRPLAGLLAYTFGDKIWYQVGASETEGRNLMPAHLLQFEVMKWAYERGLTYYDLVAIPNAEAMSSADSMWGLYVFKAGFGGRPIEWAGCLDRALDVRGYLWEIFEPLYYRLYKWRMKDVMY